MPQDRDIVYPTLTRPDVILGAIPRSFVPIAIVASAIAGVFLQNILLGLFVFPFVMFGGFIGGKIDPDFVEIWKAKRQWIKRTKGKQNGNYYHA